MPSPGVAELLEPLRAVLVKVSEAERYRILGAFSAGFADDPALRTPGPDREQADTLAKKLARVNEEKALLADALAAAKADLEHRSKQLEAEQQRSRELERIANDQRTRLQTAQGQISELEEQIVSRNTQLHQAESEVERLTVKLQRAERAAGCRRTLTIRQDPYINTACQANRPAEDQPSAVQVAVTVTPPPRMLPGGIPVVVGYSVTSG